MKDYIFPTGWAGRSIQYLTVGGVGGMLRGDVISPSPAIISK